MTTIKTGDTVSSGIACFLLTMPPDEWFRQAIVNVLLESSYDSSWTPLGTVSIKQAVELANTMLEGMMVFPFNPLPAGRVDFYAGSATPDGWLDCDGASKLTADYPELFAAIGYAFGGAGASFNLPDIQNRVLLGEGDVFSLGDIGGETEHTLTTTEIASHSHVATGTAVSDLGHTHSEVTAIPSITSISPGVPQPTALPGIGITGISSANLVVTDPTISSTGGDGAHNNMQPYMALRAIIFAGR